MKEALKLAREHIAGNYTVSAEEALAAIDKALAQPEQEPVAWMSPSWIDPDTRGWQSDSFESIPIEGWLPLYTTPPQRTWVGLTDEEISIRAVNFYNPEMYKRAVLWAQEKLKEKNQ